MVTRILFIDDDPVNNQLSKSLLMAIQPELEVETIESAEGALHYLKMVDSPDLIFLDVNMAGMDGFEFIAMFKEMNISAKVILLTSAEIRGPREKKLKEFGEDNLIIKPLTKEKFEGALEMVYKVNKA